MHFFPMDLLFLLLDAFEWFKILCYFPTFIKKIFNRAMNKGWNNNERETLKYHIISKLLIKVLQRKQQLVCHLVAM